jgi:tetratricopeptide (TPR) repeat protein
MQFPEKIFFPSSRRRFCQLLAATPLTIALPAPDSGPDAPKLYAQAIRLLTQGKRFERAIEYLTFAVEKDPKNPAYSLALGCAFASRFASVAFAALYTNLLNHQREHFDQTITAWEKGREQLRKLAPQVFDEAAYEKTRPKIPAARVFDTKDDNQPFRLDMTQTYKTLTDLSAKAQAAWEKAVALSQTPDEKALAYYVQGWGFRVMKRYLTGSPNADPTALPFAINNLPKDAEITTAFDKATEAAPNNPLYWQAKADALPPGKDADAAYLKALALRPRNAAILWYRLYNRTAEAAATDKSKWSVALEYLQNAEKHDRGNAWPLYEEAAILFRSAPYSLTGPSASPSATPEEKEKYRNAVRNDEARKTGRRAIDRIVEGNQLPNYTIPRYVGSVPTILSFAWRYLMAYELELGSFSRIRELARACGGYSQFQAEFENDAVESERAGWAGVGLGKRLVGNWPTTDDPITGRTVVESLVGIAVTTIGYKCLKKSYEALGETDKAASLQVESDAFDRTATAWSKAIQPILTRSDFDTY